MAKVAIVCDWLTNYGGAERVIETLSQMFPEAAIFTSLYNKEVMPFLKDKNVITSFIQKIPGAKKNHRPFLKLMPLAFEQFDLSQFDLVISSSHCCSKGVITKPETLHISYCHNPMRYVWDDFHDYIRCHRLHRSLRNWIYYLLSDIRVWDRLAADRVDYFVANSDCVRRRIQKYYRREAVVIYPPCNISKFSLSEKEGKYFLALGRIIPYKRFDLIVEAFNENGLPLKIVGEGSDLKHLKQLANSNIQFLGNVPDKELNQIYGQAKALIFPQREDFGIIPVEAMACGRPVICYGYGGAQETVIDGVTGVYFKEQSVAALNQAIGKFSNIAFNHSQIRSHSEKFDSRHFEANLLKFIKEKSIEWQKILN